MYLLNYVAIPLLSDNTQFTYNGICKDVITREGSYTDTETGKEVYIFASASLEDG